MWSTGNGRRGTRLFASALLLWIIWICAMQNGSKWYNLESAGHCPCKHPQRCRCSGGSKTPSPKEAARVVASLCPQIDVFKKIWNHPETPCACFFQELVQLNSALTLHVLVTTHDCSIWCVLLLSLSLSFSLSLSLSLSLSSYRHLHKSMILICHIWINYDMFGVYTVQIDRWSPCCFVCGCFPSLLSYPFSLVCLSVYRSVYRSEHVPHKLTSWFLPPCFLRWWACKSLTATKWVLRAWQKIFSETPCKIRETKFISFQPEESRDLSLYSFWNPVTLSYIPTQPQQSLIPLPGKHLRPYQLSVPGCELKWRRRSTRSVRKKSTLRSNQVSRTPRYTVP